MKTLAAFSLFLCAALLIGIAVIDYPQLPERMASHFDANGTPNGWMSRSSFTWSMIAIGLGIPAFVIGMMYSIRFFPAKFLNVPNRTYWQDPKNHGKACDFLFASSWWFGIAFLIWHVFFSRMVAEANQVSPPRLDSGTVFLLTIPLLVFTFGWVIVLLVHFSKPIASNPEMSTGREAHRRGGAPRGRSRLR
jgi:uncharacterized membrane protein